MDLLTKDLLINFLFILLSLFLLQMFYLFKYVYRLEESKSWPLGIFSVISLALCMLVPVAFNSEFVWDLRWIPFILGALYGGYKLGIFLIDITLFIRFSLGNDWLLYSLVSPSLSLICYLLFIEILFSNDYEKESIC